jgi:hypothetical protein
MKMQQILTKRCLKSVLEPKGSLPTPTFSYTIYRAICDYFDRQSFCPLTFVYQNLLYPPFIGGFSFKRTWQGPGKRISGGIDLCGQGLNG